MLKQLHASLPVQKSICLRNIINENVKKDKSDPVDSLGLAP
jgi:hypothetical protein